MPRVTVIIATYNWAPVLPMSIASVLDQSFSDFELLVVGDACTDESADVVTGIGDCRIHWHNLDVNVGHQCGPNNLGISLAQGDIIAYLGHDDLWCPSHLSNLVQAIDSGALMAHTMIAMVPPVGSPRLFPPKGWIYRPGAWIPPSSVAHKRQVSATVGPWKHPRDTGRLDPDGELWVRISRVQQPVQVPIVDCVKLSASERKDVYRTRPNEEQAYWLARIRGSNNPQAMLAKSCDMDNEAPRLVSRGVTGLLRSARRTMRRVIRKMIRKAIRKRPTALERFKGRRRLKGLDDCNETSRIDVDLR